MEEVIKILIENSNLKFDLGTTIVGLVTVIVGAIFGIKKVKTKPSETPDFKAAVGNTHINKELKKLSKKIEGNTLVSVGEVTNGGGVPISGKPLYLRITFSSDDDTLRLWENPIMMEAELVNTHSKTLLKGDTFFMKEQLVNRQTKAWYKQNNINCTYSFLIGVESGSRTIVLYVNKEDTEIMPHSEYLLIQQFVNEIRPYFQQRKWWNFKKNLIFLKNSTKYF